MGQVDTVDVEPGDARRQRLAAVGVRLQLTLIDADRGPADLLDPVAAKLHRRLPHAAAPHSDSVCQAYVPTVAVRSFEGRGR